MWGVTGMARGLSRRIHRAGGGGGGGRRRGGGESGLGMVMNLEGNIAIWCQIKKKGVCNK